MPTFDLLLITDEDRDVAGRVERALRGSAPGRVAVQLRAKGASSGEVFRLAEQLRAITRAQGAPLIINDRVDIALAVGADGVHLPESGLSITTARALLGAHALIGVSRHDRKGLEQAAQAGADYATLAPVHAVPGKNPPLGIAGFAQAIASLHLAVYALGGIQPSHVPLLRAAGARGIAAIRAVMSAQDPAEAVRDLLERLGSDQPS
jgi:thiamine-phosphate pyrophosphorylase